MGFRAFGVCGLRDRFLQFSATRPVTTSVILSAPEKRQNIDAIQLPVICVTDILPPLYIEMRVE